MKRTRNLLTILLSLAICLSLIGCTVPNGSGQSSPESTPEVTPAATPIETPAASIPEADTVSVEELEAICREKLVLPEGHDFEGVVTYLCRADIGYAFIAKINDHQPVWDAAGSATVGDFYFSGYTGPGRNERVFIYDGETIDELRSAYGSGRLSDKDLKLIFDSWVDSRAIRAYETDLSENYALLGIERVTETDKLITFVIKVAPREGATVPASETLRLGEYEFKNHGVGGYLYGYASGARFGNTGVTEISNTENYIGEELAELYEYWEESFGG